jgi:hypothetical protein
MTAGERMAYVAGIVDGEGCIRVKRTQAYRCQGRKTLGYHASIQVKMVDESAIRFVAEILGGWVFRQKPSAAQGRPLWTWQMSDAAAEAALRRLLPFLRVKRAQTENVLELRALQAEGRRHRTKITGYRNFPNQYGTSRRIATKSFSDEYVARCDAFYWRSRELNKVGVAALSLAGEG